MLTEDDDLIRAQDIPERMQLASSSLSQSSSLSLHTPLTESDLDDAAAWVTLRISPKKAQDFFSPNGVYIHLREDLVLAVSYALRYLFIQEFEVPYIWTHKRDYISYFTPTELRTRVDLLSLAELWRIYALGQKYRSLAERRNALDSSYARLGVEDRYYDTDIRPQIDSVEVVADATEWLAMKYKDKKRDHFELHFHDDEEQPETKKRKMPSRTSAYEVAKKTIISKLANVGFLPVLMSSGDSLWYTGLRNSTTRGGSEFHSQQPCQLCRRPGPEPNGLRRAFLRSRCSGSANSGRASPSCTHDSFDRVGQRSSPSTRNA